MSTEKKETLNVTDEEIISDEEMENVENDDVQLVTVETDDGEEMTFVEIDDFEVDGREFTILQPTEPFDDLEEDDVLIFEVVKGQNGEDVVELVEDDAVIDKVSEIFYKRQDEAFEAQQ